MKIHEKNIRRLTQKGQHRKPIKIKAPLSRAQETAPLCSAGAEELFCGIEPSAWNKKYRGFCINQRSSRSNLKNYSELKKVIAEAHCRGVKVHVAMNAFFYFDAQYDCAVEISRRVLDAGADGLIFADPVLLDRIGRRALSGKDVVIGTDAVIFNGETVKLFKKLGATRIVLPRSMTLEEMSRLISQDRSLEYEAFILNDLCFFEDGLCAYCKTQSSSLDVRAHGGSGQQEYSLVVSRMPEHLGCRKVFLRQRTWDIPGKTRAPLDTFTFWSAEAARACGTCSLIDMERIGISAVKVLDRTLETAQKIQATRFIKDCLDLLSDNAPNKGAFIRQCRNIFHDAFKRRCGMNNCYYPDTHRGIA